MGSAARRNLGVVCENSADRLSSPPFVVVENPAQPFRVLNTRIHVDHTVRLLDQTVFESLMIALAAVMLRVFLHYMAQILLP